MPGKMAKPTTSSLVELDPLRRTGSSRLVARGSTEQVIGFVKLYVSSYDKADEETRAILPLVRIWWPA